MTTILSICIPTLNRPEFLMKALNSIFCESLLLNQLEICISNNCSEVDYAIIDKLIKHYENNWNIKYIRHEHRLPLDENHYHVKQMATSEYIYFLGDDDFFLTGQLPLLVNFLSREAPDLAIFNGIFVNKDNKIIGPHFELPAQQYINFTTAFLELRDKGMFGAILVKKAHLEDAKFRCLFGTSHAYGCFWFSLLSIYSGNFTPKVIIPSFPLVALRVGAKSYDNIEVYFRDILYEIAVYQRYLPSGLSQHLNENFRRQYLKKISSIKFFSSMINSNIDIKKINEINPIFYKQHRFKIILSQVFVRVGAYKLLRRIYIYFFQKKKSTSFQIENSTLMS